MARRRAGGLAAWQLGVGTYLEGERPDFSLLGVRMCEYWSEMGAGGAWGVAAQDLVGVGCEAESWEPGESSGWMPAACWRVLA